MITPIKIELDQNKKASKFSIGGFYVGAFGLIITAFALLYQTFRPPIGIFPNFEDPIIEIKNSLDEINYSIHGLNENFIPSGNEFLIEQFEKAKLLQNDSIYFSVEAYIPGEEEINGKYYPFVSLAFFIDGKQFGAKGLEEKITLINKSNVSHYNSSLTSILMTEKDRFIIFEEFEFEIKRIFKKNHRY